jgi:peptide/nickel transport system permease protein
MRGYSIYLLGRLGQFVLVVFIGINIAFIVTHATPALSREGRGSPEARAWLKHCFRF